MLPILARAPLPGQINYERLTPAAAEVLGQIALRLTAGWSLEEVALELDRERPQLSHLELPPRVTKGWCSQRMRLLREELLASIDT